MWMVINIPWSLKSFRNLIVRINSLRLRKKIYDVYTINIILFLKKIRRVYLFRCNSIHMWDDVPKIYLFNPKYNWVWLQVYFYFFNPGKYGCNSVPLQALPLVFWYFYFTSSGISPLKIWRANTILLILMRLTIWWLADIWWLLPVGSFLIHFLAIKFK